MTSDGSDVRSEAQIPMSDPWIKVWLQGGPVEDWHYFTLIEPPDVIHIMADPFNDGRWLRVLGDWPQATAYRREASVEQSDRERIYYPVSDITPLPPDDSS